MKILLDSCIWGGAKIDLEKAGNDTKWVGDFLLAIFKAVPHFGIIRLVNFSARQHGIVTIEILNQYKEELKQKAIITVDTSKVRLRIP